MHQHQVYDTDNHFVIDPITKEIINQSEKMKLMLGDHNSERFTFEIPRYIDGHDMTLCDKIEIHYINIDSKTKESNKDVYIVDDMQLSPNGEGVVIFSWLISGNATQLAGTLNFRATFKCISEPSIIDYRMSTEIFKGITVSDGISNSEAVIEQYSDVLEQWKQELNLAGEYAQQIQQNASKIDELNNDLSESRDYVNDVINYEINWNDGGYISKDDGNVYDETGSSYSDYVTVMPGTKLIIANTMTENNEWNAFYDANKTFLSHFSNATGEVIVPDGAVKMRLSKYSSATLTIASNIKTYIDDSIENVEKKAKSTDDAVAELKGDTANSRKAIAELADKKITKFYANSLGETTLNDSDNGKIQDMMLYGKSFQQTYTGKNLLNPTLKTATNDGITCTNNGDGTYTLNGTATQNITFKVGTINENGTYKLLGCPNSGNGNTYYCVVLYSNSWSSISPFDIGKGATIDINGTVNNNVCIVVANGTTVNNLLFKPMIVDATLYPDTTYDDFEPYVGGIPSPNPDYPQEIQSVANPAVKVTGKNLLNPTLETTTLNGVTCTNNGDGTYTLNGTATAEVGFRLGYPKLKGEYKIVGCPSGGSYTEGYSLIQYTSNWGSRQDTGDGATHKYIGTENDARIRVVSGTVCNNLVFKPMITTDLNATYDDFEPYTEQLVTLPYTLNAIPVSESGNVTIDGQQYIADYVDIEKKQIHRLVDSSKLGPTISIVENTDLLLSSEEVSDMTDEEVQAFKDLATYYPTTNVMVTSDQLDGYTTFNYPLSMANGWNLIKEQLGDTREYVYDMELQSIEAYVNSEYAVTLAELEV